MMLNELSNGSDETWNMYQEVMGIPDPTVDVWQAFKKPRMCNYIWCGDEMTENNVVKYHDYNGESCMDDAFRFSRVYLRPATSVFAQPKILWRNRV
uniref:Uncharacterized protein n=1 Tax=Daphnia galeata TaxID=27404 RepID=A0A8J2RIE7_9CRUS|nr:unnamed protein product [Daphnia galeata]